MNLQCIVWWLLSVGFYRYANAALEEKFAWKTMEFDWPSNEIKLAAIAKGEYIPVNNCPVGMDVWKHRLFVTVPRWQRGIASTLNYINLYDQTKSPILIPYPNWKAHSPRFETRVDGRTGDKHMENEEAVISPFRLQVDRCNRLWVIDTGISDVMGASFQVVPPSILIFDLKTDALIRRIYFDSKVRKPSSFFANIAVDENDNTCSNSFAYVPDLGAYGVVIYSFAADKLWRAEHHYFHFDPLQGDYNVHGLRYQWTDGVFSISVTSPLQDGSRTIYFHGLSSTKLFTVSNRVWQNETRATSTDSFVDYTLVGDRGPKSHSTSGFMDELTGVMFFTQILKDGITCWNPKTPLSIATCPLIATNRTTMVFPNDLKIEEEGVLWMMSDNMDEYLYGTKDVNKINYRVFVGDTDDLIKGTPCG